jgi:predicted RNase H-like nuclease
VELIGLDGCKSGAWVAARPGPTFEIIHDLQPFLDRAAKGELRVVLDVPIGLIAAGRLCDAEARKRIGPRRSSVFTPPCREALVATSHSEASRLNRAASGKGIAAQAFGILSRIAAVDRLMTPDLQAHVHEGHPEVTFCVVAGRCLTYPKKRREGEQERLAILAAAGLAFDPSAERHRLGRGWMERDDVIDAAVMLLTAMRIEKGAAVRLPGAVEQRDERGLLAEMWA